MGAEKYRTFFSTITDEDVERVKKEFERLNANPKERKEFFTRVGLYDKNGNIAKRFRHLVEETE